MKRTKTFSCNGISVFVVVLPLLSDLMECKRKLFLGKANDEKCGLSQLEESIRPPVSPIVQKPREGQLLSK